MELSFSTDGTDGAVLSVPALQMRPPHAQLLLHGVKSLETRDCPKLGLLPLGTTVAVVCSWHDWEYNSYGSSAKRATRTMPSCSSATCAPRLPGARSSGTSRPG